MPLDKAYQHGYYKQMVLHIRSLFSSALTACSAIKRNSNLCVRRYDICTFDCTACRLRHAILVFIAEYIVCPFFQSFSVKCHNRFWLAATFGIDTFKMVVIFYLCIRIL